MQRKTFDDNSIRLIMVLPFLTAKVSQLPTKIFDDPQGKATPHRLENTGLKCVKFGLIYVFCIDNSYSLKTDC